MTEHQQVMFVTEASDFELQNAIFAFSELAVEKSGEDTCEAGLVIIGAACSRLEWGKTKDEVISAFLGRGLSEDCATRFVCKAAEIVQSNMNLDNPQSVLFRTQQSGLVKKLVIVALGIVTSFAMVLSQR